MTQNAYLRLKGVKSGEIKGSALARGRVGSIMVIAFDHAVSSPRDAHSGLPTGKRQHQPVLVTKEVDAASPLLWHMLVTNETISEWELRFWHPVVHGREMQYFTIQLVNACIASINMKMLDDTDPAQASRKAREEIAFTYEKIIWRYEEGGITAADDWEAPVA